MSVEGDFVAMKLKKSEGSDAGPAVTVLFAISALIAVALLVFDHYSRIANWLVIVSSVLLVAVVVALVLTARGVRRAHRQIREAEAVRSATFESASISVITCDRNAKIVEWNSASSKIFGYDRPDAIGKNAFDLLAPPELVDQYRLGFGQFIDGNLKVDFERYFEARAVDALGRIFPIEVSVAKVSENPLMFATFSRSLTRERAKELENQRLADIVRSSEDAIISVDLEGRVTAWNEGARKMYGYTPEEAINRRLTDLTIPPERWQEMGSMFRRVISGGSGKLETRRITKTGESVQVASRTFPIRDVDGQVVGMSISSHDLTEHRRLQQTEARDREQAMWRDRIETALEESRFLFWGQPVFDVKTGVVDHTELLLRMEFDGDLVLPGKFLPHAEDSELIGWIDHWAIREGIRLAAEMPVAINLSGRSVSTPDLGVFVTECLSDYSVDPGNVRFEITETAAIEHIAGARDLVEDLNAIGCSVSLDDFGTGYGSFTYVRHLAINEIKIDSSFVRDLGSEEDSLRVVKSILSVARNFSVGTVAEGIEDERTLEIVRELGIDLAQGYHLGRPHPLRN